MTNFSSLVNPIYCLQIMFRVMNIKRQQYRSYDAKQQSMINHIQNIYLLKKPPYVSVYKRRNIRKKLQRYICF